MSRYRSDARRLQGKTDLSEIIEDLHKRVGVSEVAWRVGHTAIEDGNLIVRNGDIIVSESDGEITIQIHHGDVPEIDMYPLGVDFGRRASLFGFDNGSVEDPSTAIQLDIEKNDTTIDGGKLLLWENGAVISHQPDADSESFIWFGFGSPGLIALQGKWSNGGEFSSEQALTVGSVNVGAGFGSLIYSYSGAMASTMAPVVGLVNTAGLVTSWNITASSTSSFTTTWSGTLAKVINFCSWRM